MAEVIRVQGLTELRRKLRALGPRIAKKHLQRATSQGATIVVKMARVLVPKDEGFLVTQIGKRVMKSGSRTTAITGIGIPTDMRAEGLRRKARRYSQMSHARRARGSVATGFTGFESSDAYYWRFLEFGTSKMHAKPFLRPAFESTKLLQIAKVRKVLRRAVEIEARK